jgi:arginine N-succinyltransferase
VHTLPRTRETIAAFVERSVASFAAHVDIPSEESYLFVLEDVDSRELVGTAAIHASAGSNGTYFAFRNDVIQQVSRDLNISHSVHALTLCSELTACSQLSGFSYPRPRTRPARSGAAVARAPAVRGAGAAPLRRPLLRAAGRRHRRRRPVAVLGCAGPQVLQDGFPRCRARHRRRPQPHLIVELMPHYPGVRAAAARPAQAAMGQIHPSGQLAFDLLTEEGFEADEYIDIFDGGPILQAHKHALRSFCGSMHRRVANAERSRPRAAARTRWSPTRWPAASASAPSWPARDPADTSESICLPPAAQQALGVAPGDSVICVSI